MEHIHLYRKGYIFSHKRTRCFFPIITARQHVSKQRPKLKEEATYYAGLPGQLDDEEAMYEKDIPTDTEELGND